MATFIPQPLEIKGKVLVFIDMNENNITGATPLGPDNFRILIDLSDTTNYKHAATGALELYHVANITTRNVAGNRFNVFIGVVLSVSAGDVVVAYIEPGSLGNQSGDPQRLTEDRIFYPSPLNLRVASGTLSAGVVFETISETSINSGSAIKTSRVGSPTANPAPGDLIVKIERTTGADTIRIHPFVQYQGVA